MSHFGIGDVWAILFFGKMSKGSCFNSQTWLITDTLGTCAFPMTSRCAVTGNKHNVYEQQGIKAAEIQGTRFAHTKLQLLCDIGDSWVITAELKHKMPADCHTIHMFSINIYSRDSKNMLQNCTVGERGKSIIAFWFEILATLNMTVQLLIWYSLALLICFTTQAQTCQSDPSLAIRNGCHWSARISRSVPRSPDACPWDVQGDVLTPSAVSCHSLPSICSPCLHLLLKSAPACLWPLYSTLAKFKAGEDLVPTIYDLSGRKMWEFSFLNVSFSKWLWIFK